MSPRIHQAQLSQRNEIACDTVQFVFHSSEEILFRPGQFVSLRVGIDENNNPVFRSYSLASASVRNGEIVIIVRLTGNGQGTQFFRNLVINQVIQFTGPMGFFVNELTHYGDIVYAATGTGMAPIYPMIQEALQRTEPGRVLLYWGVRHENDLFFRQELQRLQATSDRLQIHISVSQPQLSNYEGLRGRITQPIMAELPYLQKPTFYLCGTGQMIQELKNLLQTQGVDRKRQIRMEAFFD